MIMRVLTLAFALLSMNSFAAATMNLVCEGHTAFNKKTCEINVKVDTESTNPEGNLSGIGDIKCYERSGNIIHQGALKEFCYSGMVNGAFFLEAQSEIKPHEVPAQKATVTINISSNTNKMGGVARYYNGSVFKKMAIKCEYK